MVRKKKYGRAQSGYQSAAPAAAAAAPPSSRYSLAPAGKKVGKAHYLEGGEEDCELPRSTINDIVSMFKTSCTGVDSPIKINVLLDNRELLMEVDSGSCRSIIGNDTFKRLWPGGSLRPADTQLSTWSSELLNCEGVFDVVVSINDKQCSLPLLVMDKAGPSLLGRDWFDVLGIKLQVPQVHAVLLAGRLPTELQEFSAVFAEGLGTYTGPPVHIELREGVQPVFRRPRPVPYAKLARVHAALDKMEAEGAIEAVTTSEWGTPTVNVDRPDNTVRVCGDYSDTVNTVCKRDVFPMTSVNQVLDTLAGGKWFAKLDLASAYLQLTVDEETSHVLTINTTKGLFKVKRLSLGLSSAPAIFQRKMEAIMAGIPNIAIYFDDILCKATTKEELLETVKLVLRRLQAVGLRLKLEKCVFTTQELDFVGYHIAPSGISPTKEKVKAIQEMPSPKNKEELQSFLGYVNYYDRFIENKASLFQPLYDLLKDGVVWTWGVEHQGAVNFVKQVMSSDVALAHYDPALPLILACDASSYGVGAVLSHRMTDGSERPITNASRTLRPAEKNYSQLDKEGLAVIFGIKKFHMYLCGREFEVITDHKPLLGLFNPKKTLANTLSPRIIRWVLMLRDYDYKITYRPGKNHGNADCLSRLPLQGSPGDEYRQPAGVLLLEMAPNSGPITVEKVAQATRKDKDLARMLRIVLHGGDGGAHAPELQPYINELSALSVMQDCLLFGERVIIPTSLRSDMLEILHKDHIGIVKMKALARSYV